MRERMCLATREVKPEYQLLRFVCDMQGHVVPDLKAHLPGRGVWVTLDQGLIETSYVKGLFHRSLTIKTHHHIDPTSFMQVITEQLHNAAVGALGLCRAAGNLVIGYEKVMRSIDREKISFLIHASDAAQDGMNKINSKLRAVYGPDLPPVDTTFSNEVLSHRLGHPNAVHAAVLKTATNDGALRSIWRLNRFKGQDIDLNPDNLLTIHPDRRNRRQKQAVCDTEQGHPII